MFVCLVLSPIVYGPMMPYVILGIIYDVVIILWVAGSGVIDKAACMRLGMLGYCLHVVLPCPCS